MQDCHSKVLFSFLSAEGKPQTSSHPIGFVARLLHMQFEVGGRVNLCLGRSFAMIEVAALVGMLVMRFDIMLGGGTG